MSNITCRDAALHYPAEYAEVINIIEEWDNDIPDAVESLATRGGIEGVEAGSERWFDDFICKIDKSKTIENNIDCVARRFNIKRDLAIKLVLACFVGFSRD